MTSALGGPVLHQSLAPLACLLGRWSGSGDGEYPTIDTFAYLEEVTFDHVGKPFLAYTQRTRDRDGGLPLHSEAGYLRPGHRRSEVELVIAQPSGIVEVHSGRLTEDGEADLVLEFESDLVATTTTAKDVSAVRRRLVVAGDQLTYEVGMAAVGQPMTHHLSAELTHTGPIV